MNIESVLIPSFIDVSTRYIVVAVYPLGLRKVSAGDLWSLRHLWVGCRGRSRRGVGEVGTAQDHKRALKGREGKADVHNYSIVSGDDGGRSTPPFTLL